MSEQTTSPTVVGVQGDRELKRNVRGQVVSYEIPSPDSVPPGTALPNYSKVYIEGQLQTRKWEQDGQTRYTTEVVGRDMQFLDSRGGSSSDNSSSYEDSNQDMGSQNLPDSGITDDDIPF